ncbi:MAG: alpha/beta hydrolase [Candidatus Doudnabacteria bacterium]
MLRLTKKFIKSRDGKDLYYEVRAAGTDKPTLFFLHGVGGDLDAWHFVESALNAQGFSSIAMDLRGHGHSAHPDKAESYGINHLVEDVSVILRQEKPDKIILIGHSFGAIVAYHFAQAFPESLKKLVLISPIFHAPAYLRSGGSKKLAHKAIDVLAGLSPKPIRPGHSKYPAGKFHKDYEIFGLIRTIMRNSLKSYLLNSKISIDLDSESNAHQLQTETLIIAGDKDSVFPVESTKRIQSKIPRSKIEIIEGGNHVVILNNADEVTRSILNFLK